MNELRWSEPFHSIQHLLDVVPGIEVTVSVVLGQACWSISNSTDTSEPQWCGRSVAQAKESAERWCELNGFVQVQS